MIRPSMVILVDFIDGMVAKMVVKHVSEKSCYHGSNYRLGYASYYYQWTGLKGVWKFVTTTLRLLDRSGGI